MGSPSSLITYDQDNNSRFYLCLCKTSISLRRNMIWKLMLAPTMVLKDMVNVELFHSHLRIIGYDTTENVHCVKCGARLGYKVAKPSTYFPTDDPIVLFWINLTKVVEWNGNEILGPYAKKVEYDDDCAAAAISRPAAAETGRKIFCILTRNASFSSYLIRKLFDTQEDDQSCSKSNHHMAGFVLGED